MVFIPPETGTAYPNRAITILDYFDIVITTIDTLNLSYCYNLIPLRLRALYLFQHQLFLPLYVIRAKESYIVTFGTKRNTYY